MPLIEFGQPRAAGKANSNSWFGSWWTIGNAPGSIGFAGTPTAAPATTVGSGGVTLPLSNGTCPISDCSQLSANGGSFTLGGFTVVYKGRSASSGAGNATGCVTLPSASGTYPSGTALGFTPLGFGALAIYQKFGDSVGGTNDPVPGSTQAGFLLAAYYGPTVDDSMEGFSAFVSAKDTGTGFAQHKPITGFEAIAQIEGSNTLQDGYTAPLLANGSRTMVTGTSHVKNVIGHKLSHNSSGATFGFWDQYDGLYQAVTTLKVYTTLNGSAALPLGTINVTSGAAVPPASAANPVTVLIGANADGVGGQLVTYTGVSSNTITGCTGGTGTIASGSNVSNDVRAINVIDRVLSASGFLAGQSGWTGTIIAATRGGTDGDKSMLSITAPANSEVSGGLTAVRLNAGASAAAAILKAYDTTGTNRLTIGAACTLILNGAGLNLQNSGSNSAHIDSTGYVQPGVSTAAGAAATALGSRIYAGSGAPTNLVGVLGDIYFRSDTPSTSNQRVYICTTAGASGGGATWTGIL
jgi:hypothetical protein